MTKPSEKKKFRVVGVQYSKKMAVYASQIEVAMNSLRADGYSAQIQEQKDGMLLIGVLTENPLEALAEAMRKQGIHPAGLELNPRTKVLFERCIDASGNTQDPKEFIEAVQKKMTSILHGFNADELKTASDELARESVAHAKTHEANAECTLPEILTSLSELLKSAAHAQLQ